MSSDDEFDWGPSSDAPKAADNNAPISSQTTSQSLGAGSAAA